LEIIQDRRILFIMLLCAL